ncbi:MAG: gliding motility-associated C-terminal domain-containing protein [Taibaiella sp.]|nr:gliding motility-associated C-terminal domain-containing protein [Taibaiella sp.]
MFTRILFILLFLSIGYAHAQNLVTNGSFTAAAANWTFFAPGITTEAYNGETSYGGTVGTNIVAEIDNEANLRQTNIAVSPGQEYAVSFRHTRRTGNGAAPNPSVFIVKVYDGTTTYVNQTITSNNASWNWQCKVFTFTPQSNNISIDFENVTATTLGSIVDDITIATMSQQLSLNGLNCQGGTVQLQAPNASGNPDAVYTNHSWTGPNGLTATGPALTLTNLQPADAGVYTCTMTLNGCMTVTATYSLTVAPNNFNRDVAICAGETYDFYGRSLNTAGTYDTLISGGGTQCDSFITLNLSIKPLPNATISPEDEVRICSGDLSTLSVNAPTNGANYQWYKNNTSPVGTNATSFTTNEGGSYHVVATLNGCEQASNRVQVTILPNPEAGIRFVADSVCTMDTITLSALVIDTANRYTWEPQRLFSRLSGNEGPVVQGIFNQLQNKVILTVYDKNGCRAQDSVSVPTVTCCAMMMPNAFTPNGDGRNDFFKPQLDIGQTIMSFEVYDRYGSVVFGNYVGVPGPGWNGNYKNGRKADAGVYMYLLQYHCSDGKTYQRKGDVTLYR